MNGLLLQWFKKTMSILIWFKQNKQVSQIVKHFVISICTQFLPKHVYQRFVSIGLGNLSKISWQSLN